MRLIMKNSIKTPKRKWIGTITVMMGKMENEYVPDKEK